jgi:hypothetical protein
MESIWNYFGFGYMGVGILLIIRLVYLSEQLLRYIDREYPDEAPIIRTCERQVHPWSKGYRALKALIMKQRAADPELAFRAQKFKHSQIYFLVWCGFFLLAFACAAAYILLRRQWG